MIHVSIGVSLRRRLPWATAASVDVAVAVLLTAGAIGDVARLDGRYAVASLLAVACTGTVAWRRRAPTAAAGVAIAAMLAYQLATGDSRMTFEPYAVVLTFYMLGRQATTRHPGRVWAALLALALGALGIMFQRTSGDWVAAALGGWMVFAALPWALGRLVARHSALARRLEAETVRLREEQELRAKEAANEERYRMARELHDVVAHCVSVMVIQASAARLVVTDDARAARTALRTVETCGREAMVELRRIVGAVRRSDGELPWGAPGLAQLGVLVERAGAAGVPTRLRLETPLPSLPAGLEQAVYRIVQEALTNVVKHAPGATAEVKIGVSEGVLELAVTDTGTEAACGLEDLPESGHGLVGMRERVALYRGEVSAGPESGGGWVLRARIPLAAGVSVPHAAGIEPPAHAAWRPASGRWTDAVLACAWLVALEVEACTSDHRQGPLWLNALLVGSMALAFAFRRRNPLLFLVVVALLGIPLTHGLTSRDYATLTGLYSVLVPTYTVAAWEERKRAVLGLTLWCAGATLIGIFEHAPLAGLTGPLLAAGCAWTVGRVIRAHRRLAEQLRETAARLAAEREDRARLAAVGERIRIARDLQRIAAQDVVAMVVQSEAAESLLERDAEAAIEAIEAIESQGRRALAQVRLILGVLRNRDVRGALEPQPGLDQIHALVERARHQGQPVELVIEGEPGSGLAGVDLTTYRILEEVLAQAAARPGSTVAVALHFDDGSLSLDVRATGLGTRLWPSRTIRDRVALCDGLVDTASTDDRGARLVVRLPRSVQGAFA